MGKDGDSGSSPSETSAFKELKAVIIKECGLNAADDNKIARFLKARDFNVKQAFAMLKKHLEWRKQNSVDTLLRDYQEKEVFKKYSMTSTIGFDKGNAAIIILNIGKSDFKGFIKSVKKEDYVRHIIHFFESLEQKMQKRSIEIGERVDKWSIILDVENLSYYQFTNKLVVETFIECCILHDAQFPERLKTAYVINTSGPFQVIYSVVQPFLAPSTERKVKLYGKDNFKEDLLQAIDPEVLPVYLGGDRTDPDGNPLCHSFVKHGGPVPEEFYMKKSKQCVLKNQPGVKSRVLKRRTKLEVPLYVSKKESFIEWEFETEDHDIGFGLFYKDFDAIEDDELVTLIPLQRFDSYLLCETGTLKCEKPGIYILTLDNSYSRLRSKTVHYKVNVVKPDEKKKKPMF